MIAGARRRRRSENGGARAWPAASGPLPPAARPRSWAATACPRGGRAV